MTEQSPRRRGGAVPKVGERIYLDATLEQLEADGRTATVMVHALNGWRLQVSLDACIRRKQPKPEVDPAAEDDLPNPESECERTLGPLRREVAALGRLGRDLLGCVARGSDRLSSNLPFPPASLTLDGARIEPTMARLYDLGLVEIVEDAVVEDAHGRKHKAPRWRVTEPLGRCAAEFLGELGPLPLARIAI